MKLKHDLKIMIVVFKGIQLQTVSEPLCLRLVTSVRIYPCHPIISGFQYCWRAVVPRPVCPRSAAQIQLDSDWNCIENPWAFAVVLDGEGLGRDQAYNREFIFQEALSELRQQSKKADAVNLCINSPHRVNSLHMVLRVWQSTHSNFGNSVTLSSQPRFQMVPAKPKALPPRHTATLLRPQTIRPPIRDG